MSAAVAAAVQEAGALPLVDAEQLELLRGEDGRLALGAVDQARKGPGRPRGSLNKRTARIRDYLLSRYAHPLEVLAQTYTRPVDALAAELGCKKAEAFQLQLKAAAELAPYVEGKMPVAIDLNAKGDLTLIVPGMNAPATATVEELRQLTIDASDVDAETAENQGFGE